MQILIRNVDTNLSAMLKKRQQELRSRGIKINQSELASQLLEQALTSNFYEYKKDVYDKTIATLIDKFQEFIDTNNQVLEAVAGIEMEEDEEEENNEQD